MEECICPDPSFFLLLLLLLCFSLTHGVLQRMVTHGIQAGVCPRGQCLLLIGEGGCTWFSGQAHALLPLHEIGSQTHGASRLATHGALQLVTHGALSRVTHG